VVLVQFLYTRCEGICPGVTAELADVQTALGERLGREVFLISVTLDPENDGPDELRAYREAVGARPGWTFVTGAPADIDAIRRRLGVYDPNPEIDADRSQHSGKVVIGNERLGRWGSIPGAAGAKRILRMLERIEGPRSAGAPRSSAAPGPPGSSLASASEPR
jgi:protein SCO1/2